MTLAWSVPTTPEAVARRAGGRRRHNAQRQWLALRRRYMEVARLLFCRDGCKRGAQARAARELGVSRSTVCRDVQRLIQEGFHFCPTCGAMDKPPEPLFVDEPDEDDDAAAERDDKTPAAPRAEEKSAPETESNEK